MSHFFKIGCFSAALLVALLFAPRSALADARAESVAKEALQKAGADYSAMDYAGAAAGLKKAVQACGAKNCTSQTKATLLRDLGTMEFRAGDKDGASKSWEDALALDQTLTLNPSYDASDVGAAWEDARATAGLPAGAISSKAPPPSSGGARGADAGGRGAAASARPGPQAEMPTGDFEHEAALEQKEDTPLPIHVEYAGQSKLLTVVLKYKGAQMRDWARVELTHVEGKGYEGVIPCSDVTRGTMRYWVQGFDKSGDPVAATGDPKHTFSVVIRDKIASEPPHLPGKAAPRSCEEVDCPPGLPGCKSKGAGGAGPGTGTGTGPGEAGTDVSGGAAEEGDETRKKGHGPPYARLWLGVSFSLDFLSLSAATNVCARDQNTGNPVNSQGYYCYDSVAGADFPSKATNPTLSPTEAGTTTSGVQVGDIRATVAFDYALSPSFLLGVRAGYVFNAYPGKSAINQGHAFFAPLHFEGRATYLFGNAPLARKGFSPMGFLGFGASEFDGHQSTAVRFTDRTPQKTVDVWLTDAPFFAALGGGVRYQFSLRAALTAAARLNVVVGGNGLLPTFGPELGVLYGF